MRAFIGCVLVILAGGMTGFCLYSDLIRSLRRIETMISVAETFRTEVCVRLRPLPEAAAMSLSDIIGNRIDADSLTERLKDMSFSMLWTEEILGMELPMEAEEALVRLGESLSRGENAERAFTACALVLERSAERLRKKAETDRRLYPALGFSSGCMLSILFL